MYGPGFNAPITSGSAAEFRVAASTTSVVILSGSMQRHMGSVYNHSSASLYLRYSPNMSNSASLAMFSVKLSSGSYFELPVAFQGVVHGIWDGANGYAYVIDFQSGE